MSYAGGVISNVDVDSSEDIALIPVDGRARLNVAFAVTTAALTAFEVWYLPTAAGSQEMLVASSAADYTTPAVNSAVRGASGDLTIAASGATHWVILDTAGVARVRLKAAGTSSVVSGSWGAT